MFRSIQDEKRFQVKAFETSNGAIFSLHGRMNEWKWKGNENFRSLNSIFNAGNALLLSWQKYDGGGRGRYRSCCLLLLLLLSAWKEMSILFPRINFKMMY